MGVSASDVVLPVVPMFHVNAWGLPYTAALVGCKIVFPGGALDGKSLYELFETEKVTFSAGVPTVWLGLLNYVRQNGLRFSTFRKTVIGGSACPPAMIRTLTDDYGVEVVHAWGMTEMSPLGTTCKLQNKHLSLPDDAQRRILEKQGHAIFGVDMKVVDPDGRDLPWDGVAFGDLLVRGPWVVREYFKGRRRRPARRPTSTAPRGSRPATSDTSTPTGTCRSPTAARTSSSPAANGSVRSTSRTSRWRIRPSRWPRSSPCRIRSGTSGRC